MLSNNIQNASAAGNVEEEIRMSDRASDPLLRLNRQRSRDELQSNALKVVLDYHRLILNWGTGVGKSRVAVRLMDTLVTRGRTSILLLVQETAHKKNWKRELVDTVGERRTEQLLNCVTIECYASLYKHEGTSWDCIIADEAHHLRSDIRTSVLSTMSAKYVLCLTATLSEKGDADLLIRTLNETFGEFQTLWFDVPRAIENKIIAEPRVYVHVLDLAKISRPQTILVDWGMPWMIKGEPKEVSYNRAKYMFDHRGQDSFMNFQVSCTCPADKAYAFLTEVFNARKQEKDDLLNSISCETDASKRRAMHKQVLYAEKAIKLAGARRKNFLGHCKTVFAAWLLRQLDASGKKYICFCSDVAQGVELGGDNAIYAKRGKNLEVIDAFNDGEIHNLFAVDMIQEGQNLNGIDAGVIIQLGGKERAFIQKFGRVLRSKSPEQHIIVIDHTRDVDYLKIAIENINRKYVFVKYWPPKKTAR